MGGLRGRGAALGCTVRIWVTLAGLFLALSKLSAAGLGVAGSGAAPDDAGWSPARPGWQYEFPRDHGPHQDFKTEWWYFTGNLRDANSGRSYGYELTFFRQGI